MSANPMICTVPRKPGAFDPGSSIRAAILLLSAALVPALASAQVCPPECRIEIVDGHPHEALRDLVSDAGLTIIVQGTPLAPITATVSERSLDQLIRSAGRRAGYLVARAGAVYTFYGRDVDRQVAQRITMTHPMKFLAAADAAAQLSTFSGMKASVLRDANAVVLRGSLEELRDAVELLETIDQQRPNVFLELLVVEYFHGDAYTWSFNIVEGTKGNVSELAAAPGLGSLTGLYSVVADLPVAFRLNLTALVGQEQAKVVTNPHLAVRNGEPGRIDFQEELHVILTNETVNFGTTRTLEPLQAGVSLQVTPQVTASGSVDLDVAGEVAVFTSAPEGQFAIDRQRISTKVIVESGSTLVIGGLVKKSVSAVESGVPVLRRIPLLGRLFREEVTDEQYVETVIYITPRIGDARAFSPDTMAGDVEEQFRTQRRDK